MRVTWMLAQARTVWTAIHVDRRGARLNHSSDIIVLGTDHLNTDQRVAGLPLDQRIQPLVRE